MTDGSHQLTPDEARVEILLNRLGQQEVNHSREITNLQVNYELQLSALTQELETLRSNSDSGNEEKTGES